MNEYYTKKGACCVLIDQMVDMKEWEIDNVNFKWKFLWQQVNSWLREYLINKTLKADEEYLNEIIAKISSIIQEYIYLFKIFFGDKVVGEYEEVMKKAVGLFISLIDALSEDDTSRVNQIALEIYQGIEERTKYLFELNPYWVRSKLNEYIFYLTNMTIQQIITFMEKDYKNSIAIYDRILKYTMIIGDYLAQGTKKYFNNLI